MKNFDFYEFSGLLSPGSIALLGIFVIYPDLPLVIKNSDFTIGNFGLFVILAYVIGHLVQGAGNFLECFWWKLRGGMPTDWIRQGKKKLLAKQQLDKLPLQLQHNLGFENSLEFEGLDKVEWSSIVRQVYANVESSGRNHRVDIFNANYGLFRGIATALLLVLIISLFESQASWTSSLLLILGVAVAIHRMDRFGKYYAREVFVQFLQISE